MRKNAGKGGYTYEWSWLAEKKRRKELRGPRPNNQVGTGRPGKVRTLARSGAPASARKERRKREGWESARGRSDRRETGARPEREWEVGARPIRRTPRERRKDRETGRRRHEGEHGKRGKGEHHAKAGRGESDAETETAERPREVAEPGAGRGRGTQLPTYRKSGEDPESGIRR